MAVLALGTKLLLGHTAHSSSPLTCQNCLWPLQQEVLLFHLGVMHKKLKKKAEVRILLFLLPKTGNRFSVHFVQH